MGQPDNDSKKVKILLVDDEDAILETSKMMLELLGYEVIGAMSADEALAKVDKDDGFDLILTDLFMPGKDGRDLAIELRQRQCPAKIAVISGFALKDEDWSNDFDALFMKPFQIQELQSKLEDLLES